MCVDYSHTPEKGEDRQKRSDCARQISGGISSVGNLYVGTGREVDTKPADYRPAGCVRLGGAAVFVSVTHRPNRKGRSA